VGKKGFKVLTVGLILLGIASFAFALTNEEKLNLLEEKFLKGEVSEKIYLELREKYGGVTKAAPAVKEAKPVTEVKGNLIKNFSFEKLASDGSAEGWVMDYVEARKLGDMSVSASVAHSGKNSMKIFSGHGSPTAYVIQEIPLRPGKSYRVFFWAKGENLLKTPGASGVVNPCAVSIRYKGKDNKNKNIWIEPAVGNEWQKIAKIVNIPGNSLEGGAITLRIFNSTGTLWIDDVSVVPL